MSKVLNVQYNGQLAPIDLTHQFQCMEYIQNHVIPSCMDGTIEIGTISYRKITKNDNIKETIDKLETLDTPYVCLYSYGPHIQKLLSIVEILKKVLLEKQVDTPRQWNKLTCFNLTTEGRNELLEKHTRVPILITMIEIPNKKPLESLDLPWKSFTQQV